MTRLTLNMIVRNEEELLPRCLASVAGLVDSQVIVDTGSTDRTVEVAQNFGATVHQTVWPDDFALARNEALSHAEGDWILVLDADEYVEPSAVPAIRRAIQREDSLALNLLRREIGSDGHPYSLVSRLFRKHSALRFSGAYHAQIDDTVAEILSRESQWHIGQIPGISLHHDGYRKDRINRRAKFDLARRLMEKDLARNPSDPYLCSKLGALYVSMNLTARGVELLRRGLAAAGGAEAATLYELHYHLGIALMDAGSLPEAARQFSEAIDLEVAAECKAGAILNLANVKKTEGDLKSAIGLYRTVIEIAPEFALAHLNLGLALVAAGQVEQAIGCYRTAISLTPGDADAYQNLGAALFRLGRKKASLQHFAMALDLHRQNDAAKAQELQTSLQKAGLFDLLSQ